MLDFEVKAHDLAGRIGRLRTKHGTIETPTVLPVVNPNRITIHPNDMGADAIITNAYILWKHHYDEAVSRGIHDLLGCSKPIMTDSGAYQLMEYGDIDVANEEIIDFEKRMGVDIGVILDTPCKSQERAEVESCFKKTMQVLRESPRHFDESTAFAAPIQGSVFPDLVRKCSIEASGLNYGVHALGSVVPLLVNYEYDKVVDAIAMARQNMPWSRPLHLFGAGHPMIFSFSVALGVDLFDSAAYALYAKDNRYMTQTSTLKLGEMKYLPCPCPVCIGRNANDLLMDREKERLLAQHNLNVTFGEINTIKEAINDGSLWELIEQRANAHPYLMRAFRRIMRHRGLLGGQDPLTKKHVFITSKDSEKQPAVEMAKKRAKGAAGTKTPLPPYGNVPFALLDCYPFNQTISAAEQHPRERKSNDYAKIKAISEYWFGTNIFSEPCEIKHSRKTGRIRGIIKDGKTQASLDSSTYLILLHDAAYALHKKSKKGKHRVVVHREVAEFAREGKNVFAKFVVKCDPSIVPGQPVIVVDEKDNLLCAGEALMSAKEMLDFGSGVAVRPRWHV